MKKNTRRRLVKLEGDVHDTVEERVSGEKTQTAESSERIETDEAIEVGDDDQFAEVGAEFSQTINTGDFTSVRISSYVRVCCKNKPDAIKKRAQWCEDFVIHRVSLNTEPYIR